MDLRSVVPSASSARPAPLAVDGPKTRQGAAPRRQAASLLERIEADHDLGDVAAHRIAQEVAAVARAHGDRVLEARALLASGRRAGSAATLAEAVSELALAAHVFGANQLHFEQVQAQLALARAHSERDEPALALQTLQALADRGLLTLADRVELALQRASAHLVMQQPDRARAVLDDGTLAAARSQPRVAGPAALLRLRLLLTLRLIADRRETWLTQGVADGLSLPAVPDAALAEALAQAEALRLRGEPALALEQLRALAGGLTRSATAIPGAGDALAALALRAADRWPVRAAAAWLDAGMLRRLAGQANAAEAALREGLRLAMRHGQGALVKGLLFELGLAQAAAGRPGEAFETLRRLQTLHTPWRTLPAEPAPSSAVVRPFAVPEAAAVASPRSPAAQHLHRAERFIDAHLAERLRVPQVAAHCGVSRRTLEIVFRTAKGVTVADHIRRRKLESAADQLRHTNAAVKSIAAALGYSSASSFSRDFRRTLGQSPLSMRHAGEAPSTPAAPGARDAATRVEGADRPPTSA